MKGFEGFASLFIHFFKTRYCFLFMKAHTEGSYEKQVRGGGHCDHTATCIERVHVSDAG